MNVINDITEYVPRNGSAAHTAVGGCTVALGRFDGVHLAHKAVISAAARSEYPAVVLTFSGKDTGGRLLSDDDTEDILCAMGTDTLIRQDFEQIRNLTPEEFFTLLLDKLSVKEIYAGYNYRFGKNAAGDADTLRRLADEHCVVCSITDCVSVSGIAVSSTEIRSALAAGDIKTVNALLGYTYSIKSEVLHGDERGRTLGFPTINQAPSPELSPIKFGVYATETDVGGTGYKSITNVGIRPTFDKHTPVFETYIFDYTGMLYGETLRVRFIDFIRAERKFDSAEALKSQVELDKIKRLSI